MERNAERQITLHFVRLIAKKVEMNRDDKKKTNSNCIFLLNKIKLAAQEIRLFLLIFFKENGRHLFFF